MTNANAKESRLFSPNHILLVEDNDVDAFIANVLIEQVCHGYKVKRFVNGQSAKEYLTSSDNPLPGIILLDLNMPVMGGKEFLSEMNQFNYFRGVKVAILSSSVSKSDLDECLELGAKRYFEKPLDQDKTFEIKGMISPK